MNVLFVGLGSIGRRNLEACLRVRPNYRYAAIRSGKGAADLGALASKVQVLGSWDEAREFGPRSVWICNPTALHRESTEQAVRLGSSVFLEKPVGHRVEDVRAIAECVERSGQPFFYGCILREHPMVRRAKDLIDSQSLGRPISYQTYCGSYLPNWRPGRDYREIYSARKELGGGAALDLIHDFDYPEFWFGPVRSLSGRKAKLSHLEVDCEDYCSALVTHESGVSGQTTVNYFRSEPKRSFEVLLTSGLIEGDLIAGELRWSKAGTQAQVERLAIDRDELHDRQAARLFSVLESGGRSPWNVRDVARLTEYLVSLEGA